MADDMLQVWNSDRRRKRRSLRPTSGGESRSDKLAGVPWENIYIDVSTTNCKQSNTNITRKIQVHYHHLHPDDSDQRSDGTTPLSKLAAVPVLAVLRMGRTRLAPTANP